MVSKIKQAKVVIEEENDEDSSHSNSESENDSEEANSGTEQSEIEEIDQDSDIVLNEAWADSIAKILKTNKPKKKKTLVLSKAKKLTDPVKKVITENYEIATEDGKVRKEETVIQEKKIINTKLLVKKRKRELPSCRVKPNILEKDRERSLQKIATRGVVQLFNAVHMQQKTITQKLDEAGPLEGKREKVLRNIDKKSFLDLLMGEKSSAVDENLIVKDGKKKKQKNISEQKSKHDEKESSWNVLRNDFLSSAKIKDWDKELEDNDESEKEMEIEVESD